MWFTRAAMSASRCIKLLHMMGLHRLDDPNAEFEMAPTIAPPKDWTELEGGFPRPNNTGGLPPTLTVDSGQRGGESFGARLLSIPTRPSVQAGRP